MFRFFLIFLCFFFISFSLAEQECEKNIKKITSIEANGSNLEPLSRPKNEKSDDVEDVSDYHNKLISWLGVIMTGGGVIIAAIVTIGGAVFPILINRNYEKQFKQIEDNIDGKLSQRLDREEVVSQDTEIQWLLLKALDYEKRPTVRNYRAIIETYHTALNIKPDHAHVARILGNRAQIYDKLKEYDKALSDYSASICADPTNAIVYMNRGVLYQELKKYNESLDDFDEALRLDGEVYDALKGKGDTYARMYQYEEAEKIYKELLRRPIVNKHRIYADLGTVLLRWGRVHEAEINYKFALHIKPNDLQATYGLAQIDRQRRAYQAAIEKCELLTQLYASSAGAYRNLADAQRDNGDFHNAIKSIVEAIKLLEDQKQSKELAECYVQRCDIYIDLFNNDDSDIDYMVLATQDIQLALEEDPRCAPAYVRWAMLKNMQGEIDRSEELYKKALQYKPNSISAHLGLGELMSQLALYNDAMDYFLKAIKIHPYNLYSYVQKGKCYEEQEKWKLAEREYQQIQKNFPEFTIGYKLLISLYIRTLL